MLHECSRFLTNIIRSLRCLNKIFTLCELYEQFPTKQSAIEYFEELRWGDTPFCTKCGATEHLSPQKKRPGRYWCRRCMGYFTALTGTPMEYTKIDLRKWIWAAVSDAGIS